MSVRGIMATVLVAMLPAAIARAWTEGVEFQLVLALAVATSLLVEALALKLREQPVRPFASDLSAPVCAVLLALLLPTDSAWWIACLGACVSIAVAKQAYGGLGENVFNPAMVAYAFLLLAFPDRFDAPPGSASGLQAVLFAAGGALLLWRKIVSWHAPVAFLASVTMGLLAIRAASPGSIDIADLGAAPGTLLLAAFFIVSDPVTGCLSPSGRWLFGLGAGALMILLGTGAGAVTGHALPFAVLLMNTAAPWIDARTRPPRRQEAESR